MKNFFSRLMGTPEKPDVPVLSPEGIRRIFSDIPTLRTSRLTLRGIVESDCMDMYEYSCLQSVTQYLLWYPHSDPGYTRRYIGRLREEYREGRFYDWGITVNEGTRSKLIGTCGFTQIDCGQRSGEIGYVLSPSYWGMGIAPEAAARVVTFGFETLGLNRIEARYMTGNSRSRRVMEKIGMKYEGTHRQSMFVKGEYRDIGVCSILSSEYAALTGKNIQAR